MRVARNLIAHGARRSNRVILLDRADHHLYTPLLYEVASSCLEGMPERKLAAGVTSRLSEFAREAGFEFYKGEVSSVDWNNKKVALSDGSALDFEALVFAVGAETDFFDIPNLAETAYTLKTLDDALKLRRKIMEFIAKKKEGKEVQIQIIIGGGGATGVESAAELAGSFHHLVKKGEIKDGDWSITLVEATSRVLSMLIPAVSEYARLRLEKLGVKVLRDTCIKRVENGNVVLAPRPLKAGENPEALLCDFRTEMEKKFEADVLIWAGGIRANPLLSKLGLPVDRKGRVEVGTTMEVKGKERENVYAVGDCAFLADPKTGAAPPAIAQAALEQARVAAANIINDLQGMKTRRHYRFRAYPVIAPLGGKSAVAAFRGMVIRGFCGYLLRQASDLRYFLTILPFWKAVKLWFKGALVYIHND